MELRKWEREAKVLRKVVVEEEGHMWEQVEGAQHRQVEVVVVVETRKKEAGVAALPQQLVEEEDPRKVELVVVHMLEVVEVVEVPHTLVEVVVSHTLALHAQLLGVEVVHTLAEVVVVVERSG